MRLRPTRGSTWELQLKIMVECVGVPSRLEPSLCRLTSENYGRLSERQQDVSVHVETVSVAFYHIKKESSVYDFIFLQSLQKLIKHHIEAFNYMVDEGLTYAIEVMINGV